MPVQQFERHEPPDAQRQSAQDARQSQRRRGVRQGAIRFGVRVPAKACGAPSQHGADGRVAIGEQRRQGFHGVVVKIDDMRVEKSREFGPR
jgi:hypothetical protein